MYGTQMVAKFGSSSQGRRARKQYNPAAFTRAGALKILSETQDLYVCSMFEKHENKHVQARAVSRAAAIASAEIERIENRRQETVTVAVVSADDERFSVLVERFKAEEIGRLFSGRDGERTAATQGVACVGHQVGDRRLEPDLVDTHHPGIRQ